MASVAPTGSAPSDKRFSVLSRSRTRPAVTVRGSPVRRSSIEARLPCRPGVAVKPSLPQRSSFPRTCSRGFAAGAIATALFATALTACGPRDEPPIAGGAAAVAPRGVPDTLAATSAATLPAQAEARAGSPVPPAAPTPTPAYVLPPPVTVAAAPAQPGDYRQDAPPQSQPAGTGWPPAPAVEAPAVPRNRVGSITAIEPVRQRPQGSGAGAVIGGVLGGVIGNQFGHGLGRAAMTGVGAAGGAIAGNNVERNYKTAVVGYRVHVRLDNGSTRTFERKHIGDLHVGDRVRLDAKGFRRA